MLEHLKGAALAFALEAVTFDGVCAPIVHNPVGALSFRYHILLFFHDFRFTFHVLKMATFVLMNLMKLFSQTFFFGCEKSMQHV